MIGRLWQLCSASCGVPAELSDRYRRLWDGLPPPPAIEERKALCAFLGDDTKERRPCDTCNGRVMLKVFGCHHPGHAGNPETTLRECQGCRDYNPFGRGEKPEQLADAVISRVEGGDVLLDDQFRRVRLAACAMCHFCHAGRCTEPTAPADLEYKASWQSEHCPLKKWPGDDILPASPGSAADAAAAQATAEPEPRKDCGCK